MGAGERQTPVCIKTPVPPSLSPKRGGEGREEGGCLFVLFASSALSSLARAYMV